MLVTMGGLTDKGEWKQYDFLPFAMLRKQWQTVVLKLIRKRLSDREKKKVQSRLQKAFTNNGEGFYVHAPKQRGNVKEQLRYIGRYIRRPAIGINRIEAYDSQCVTFKYKDKTDGKEKNETVSVEEFDGDPTTPPMFSCEKYGGQMYLEYYEGVHGKVQTIGYSLNKKGPGGFCPVFLS
jgi:hypothetical protein